MEPRCTGCRSPIPLADVNVSTDVALCRRCGRTHSYAELVRDASETPVDLGKPPGGAWFREIPRGFEVGASTRSFVALFLVPFACVWSGGSLSGIYGTQIARGELDLFLSLFGIPFLLGSIFLWTACAMAVLGKVVVRVEGDEGTAFTGAGPFGRTRRFSWREVSSVKGGSLLGANGKPGFGVSLEGPQPVSIGTGLTPARLRFLRDALREMHRRR